LGGVTGELPPARFGSQSRRKPALSAGAAPRHNFAGSSSNGVISGAY